MHATSPRCGRRPRWLRGCGVLALCAAALAAGVPAQAQVQPAVATLLQAFQAATTHDAVYRAAFHENEAVRRGIPIARAALLPVASLNVANTAVQGSRSFGNALGQDVRVRLDYDAPQANLSLRMPLFNREAWRALELANKQSEVADLIFRGQALELMDRTASAYLQLFTTDEARRLLEQQIQAVQTQVAQSTEQLERGEGTRVQLARATAALEVAQSRLAEAQAQQELAQRVFRRVVGTPPVLGASSLAALAPPPLAPQGLDDWLETARRQNPSILARTAGVEAARLNVQRLQAAHYPRLDMVASVARNENEASNTVGQSNAIRSLGVQLQVPLFAGGGTQAAVEQALSRQARAEEELRDERETVEVEVLRHWGAVHTGERRIEALQRTLASAELAAQGMRRARAAGLATLAEVADAEAGVHMARRDLLQANADYLQARIRLMVRAGVDPQQIGSDADAIVASAPPEPNK